MRQKPKLSGIVSVSVFFCCFTWTTLAAQETTSVCDLVKLDMEEHVLLEILDESNLEYTKESLDHLYDPNNTKKPNPAIPEIILASYPRELVYGTVANSQGMEIAFIFGIGKDGLVGAMSCSKVYSP